MKLLVFGAFGLIAASSQAALITFDDLAVGATLGSQYAGVTFAPGTGGLTVPNPIATTQGFAPNTNMSIVSATGNDVGGGVSAPASGNLLHSYAGWLSETTRIAVTMGDYSDWVGVDNVAYTAAVPEPATMAALGLGAAALLRRRRKA